MDFSKTVCILLFASLTLLHLAHVQNESMKSSSLPPVYNYSIVSIEKHLVNDLASIHYQRELEIETWDRLLSSCVRVVENTLAF